MLNQLETESGSKQKSNYVRILHVTFAHRVSQTGFCHSCAALDDVLPPSLRVLAVVHALSCSCGLQGCSPVMFVEVSIRPWWSPAFLWSRMYTRPYYDGTHQNLSATRSLGACCSNLPLTCSDSVYAKKYIQRYPGFSGSNYNYPM